MHKSPLIISGIGRSGTSAVISSMSKHKSVVEPLRVGEAPIFNQFIEFLIQYEDKSPNRDYHVKNYQLDKSGRDEAFSNLLSQLQYGFDVNAAPETEKFWIAKTSLGPAAYLKACEIFKELRIIYVMRNGIEVINSAMSFDGFKNLSFEQLCNRWVANIEDCQYVFTAGNCAVVKHDELVSDPSRVYSDVFDKLGMEHDDAPAKFISKKLFNSSFDNTADVQSTAIVFENRLACWSDWSQEMQATFIKKCDHLMREHEFTRPYDDELMKLQHKSKGENVIPAPSVKFDIADQLKELSRPCMSPNQLNYYANISPNHSYLYMENPKVASTSTLRVLQQFENRPRAEQMSDAHSRDDSPLPRLSSIPAKEQVHILTSPDIFRFTFVRNPYSRLLSAYLSKIEKPLRPKSEILAIIKGVDITEINDLCEHVDFATFVDVVCSQSSINMNVHWKNQIDQTLFGKIDYSIIGKFENLLGDMQFVCNEIFSGASYSMSQSENKTNSNSKILQYYTPDIADKVYQKFYDDFHAFDYAQELLGDLAA
ncbi:MAG: sulfotransferase family 2 domain-containing protein [Granulosicoccus sp.]